MTDGSVRNMTAACGRLVRCALAAVLLVVAGPALSGDGQADLLALQQELLSINRELMFLEEDLLYPPSSRVAVYLSVDAGELFELQAVRVKLNGRDVAHHLYSDSERDALLRGAVQPLYVGNVPQGENELVALFTGHGPRGREMRNGTELRFDKSFEPAYVTLQVVDDTGSQQPVLRAQAH